MTEKIEWYKEVLELEPNSKVFFPLARLLNEASRPEEAAEVLERGLERHGEFLEARLFLIELLHRLDKKDACALQLEKLSDMLSAYAGFWQAWAAWLAEGKGSQDAATALRFVAANYACGPLSLHDVLNKGLAALLQDTSIARGKAPVKDIFEVRQQPLAEPDISTLAAVSSSVMTGQAVETVPSVADVFFSDDDSPFEEEEGERFDPDLAMVDDNVLSEAAGTVFSEKNAAVQLSLLDAEDGEERFSLRTRSMAEVLAEQGDIQGALDIYHELLAAATTPGEVADLQQRITTLDSRLNSQRTEENIPQMDEPVSSKDKLISILGALAERVEARAQG